MFTSAIELRGSEWRKCGHITRAPSPRSYPGVVYDRTRNRTVLFGGGASRGDVWEYWNPQPGVLTPFGNSCRHSGNVTWSLRAAPGSRPVIGKTFVAEIGPLPSNPFSRPFFFVAGSRLSSPLPLCVLNACGCNLYLPALQTVQASSSGGGVARLALPIPRWFFLVGADIYLQGAVLELTRPQQIATTQAATLRIGASKW